MIHILFTAFLIIKCYYQLNTTYGVWGLEKTTYWVMVRL